MVTFLCNSNNKALGHMFVKTESKKETNELHWLCRINIIAGIVIKKCELK